MTFLKKLLFFFIRYTTHDPLFVLYYAAAYFRQKYLVTISFFSTDELAGHIKQGKSIIRIGDGEIGLLHGRDISYQRADKELVWYLRKSIEDYNKKSPYILAIPVFAGYTNEELKKKNVFTCWLPLKIEFKRIFNKNTVYADAHFFYYKNNFEKYLESYLKTKKLIINTAEENIQTQRATIDRLFTVLEWIPSQSPEPFELFNQTKKKIDATLAEYRGARSDIILILGSGPMSKALAYEYSRRGIQSLDVGRGFEHIYNSNNFEHFI